MLSGSGSAVFGRFASQEQARRAADVLANEGASWTAVAKNLPRTASLAVRVEA
jgi:4-diphosphocytidyl-2C-methyl-D-erythritol kinase